MIGNFMKMLQFSGLRRLAGWLMLAGLAAGCATNNKTVKTSYYFYPPPPDVPHLQYLTSFNSEQEMGGNASRSFMSYITGQKPPTRDISKPYGVAVRDHKLYICDTDYGAVLEADLKQRSMSVFMAQGQGVLRLPLNIAIDAAGNFYVADSGRDQVVIFDKDENYVAAMGKLGEMKPRDVAVSSDRIYIADIQNHNVHVYDRATRNPLFTIPREPDATNAMRRLYSPTNLALDSKGRLYVSDTGAFRVQVYDAADGDYLRTVGGMGDSPGQFARVKGIAVDRDCRLYAVDAMSQVVQVFNEQGKLLTWFGEPGASGRIQNLPAKVMVDYDDVGSFQSLVAPGFKVEYLVFVINQIGSHLVSVYGFGHEK
jgi:DNA-binding beta-propeller fold protein YncE